MSEKFDVIVVGAGMAGNACAYVLAQGGLKVLQIERGETPGSKNVQGAILYADAIERIIPDFRDDAPLERHMIEQRLWIMDDNAYVGASYRSEDFNQEPYNRYTILRTHFDQWFNKKVREAGALVICETTVTELLLDGKRVIGVLTDRKGGEIYADAVVLCDGVNSRLATKAGFHPEIQPKDVALAVKEIHFLPQETIEARFNLGENEGVAIEMAGKITAGMPNLTFAYPDHEAAYVENNSIVRLNYYFENDGDDTFNISDFYKDYMAENQAIEFQDDGTPYTLGVPFNKSTEVLVYNESFFNWATTRDASITVPSTWDELLTVGPKINTLLAPYFGKYIGSNSIAYNKESDMPAGVSTIFDFSTVAESDFRPLSYDSQSNFFITACRQWGGKYTEVEKGNGYLAFDSTEVKSALSYFQDGYNRKALGIPANWDEAKYSSTPFKYLETVMAIGSSAGVSNDAPTGNKFTINVAPLPYHEADKKFVISQGTNLVMLDQGTNAQRIAAWKLIKYLSKEANGEFSALTGYFPSCEYASQSEAYSTFLSQVPASTADKIRRNTALVNRDIYMASGSTWTKFVDPPFSGSSTVRNAVDSAMRLVSVSFQLLTPPTPKSSSLNARPTLRAAGKTSRSSDYNSSSLTKSPVIMTGLSLYWLNLTDALERVSRGAGSSYRIRFPY